MGHLQLGSAVHVFEVLTNSFLTWLTVTFDSVLLESWGQFLNILGKIQTHDP